MQPLLRWAGSKRASLDILRAHWSDTYELYIEPFCGSAALYFSIEPKKAVLSDLNRELVNFYKVVRRTPEALHRQVAKLPRDRDSYYKFRQAYNCCRSDAERAKLFLYLNKNCFNGLYRTSKVGNFNVPFSGDRTGAYPPAERFVAAGRLLRSAHLRHGDFEKIVTSSLSGKALVYLDPPYGNGSRTPFAEYHPNSFTPGDHDRLELLLRAIDGQGSHFLLSYSADRSITARMKRWNISTVRVRRNISGFAGSRKLAREILVTNFG